MISEHEYKDFKENLYLDEPETIKREITIETIFKLVEEDNIYDILPMYDLQDEELTQYILEVYKILFWGVSALVSTLLWLYFFLT
jgi:hypothetical protein